MREWSVALAFFSESKVLEELLPSLDAAVQNNYLNQASDITLAQAIINVVLISATISNKYKTNCSCLVP